MSDIRSSEVQAAMRRRELKNTVRFLRTGTPWRNGHATHLVRQVYHRDRNEERGFSDGDHLRAAAHWLEVAQDVTGDGGVCGRYSLARGWTSSYPETTGYILPTFLHLAARLEEDRFNERARRCLEFLLPLQLGCGAFPGGEIAENRSEPSPFNTAQIIHGLVAWHRATGDERALDAARRAGKWLLEVQDQDGAFRRHYYLDVATTYAAHASCWMAELGRYIDYEPFMDGAGRHLDWVLRQWNEDTGWFDGCGFRAEQHELRESVTHTIAYTLWGVLLLGELLDRPEAIVAVQKAAHGIARRIELSGFLPGILDHRWRKRADSVCLTGNVQMALIWMRLHEIEPDLRLLNAALKAIDHVKVAQRMGGATDAIRGGIAGSDPIWGDYIPMAIPNWAAKFFVDALLAKERVMGSLVRPAVGAWRLPSDVPTVLPEIDRTEPARRLKVVMLTSPEAKRPAQMLEAWGEWGLRPDVLAVTPRHHRSVWVRLTQMLRTRGVGHLLRKLAPVTVSGQDSAAEGRRDAPGSPDPRTLGREKGIPVVDVPTLTTSEGVEAVRALEPDLLIYAGAGILRAPLLAVPRLGTLNAHMGLLPHYRGMNVAEWAALQGDPVGCTVHLIAPGIDTGDILCARSIPIGAKSVDELRAQVDRAQLRLLGEVLRWILKTGELPPRRSQTKPEGVQFFRMHVELRDLLDQELRRETRARRIAS